MSETIKGMPDAIEAIESLESDISELSSDVQVATQSHNNHIIKKASTTELGHVKVDGETITIDESGTISSVGGSASYDDKIYNIVGDSSGNVFTLTDPDLVLEIGTVFKVKPDKANNVLFQLNVNGTGAKFVTYGVGEYVGHNIIKANTVYTLLYTGAEFELQGNVFGLSNSYNLSNVYNAASAKALNDVFNMFYESPIALTPSSPFSAPSTSDLVVGKVGAVRYVAFNIRNTLQLTTSSQYQIATIPIGYRPTYGLAATGTLFAYVGSVARHFIVTISTGGLVIFQTPTVAIPVDTNLSGYILYT